MYIKSEMPVDIKIYLITTDESDYIYIGATHKPLQWRLASHICEAFNPKHTRYAWLKEEVLNNHQVKIVELETVPAFNDWGSREKFYIEYFRSLGLKITNVTIGGMGNPIVTEETRKKISLAQKGRKKTKEQIEKLVACAAAANRGKKRSPETRQKMREGHLRRKLLQVSEWL